MDITPPLTPSVMDDGETTTNTTSLHAIWSSRDDESEIIEYQYAIGTSPGETEISAWSLVANKTEVKAINIDLSPEKLYYISVKARNGAGLWSKVSSSNGITVVVKAEVTKTTSIPLPELLEKDETIEKEMTLPQEAPETPPTLVAPLPETTPDTTPIPSTEAPKKEETIEEESVPTSSTEALGEEEVIEPEITPPPAIEKPKEELTYIGEGDLKMAVQVYEEPEYVKLYIYLRNIGDKKPSLSFLPNSPYLPKMVTGFSQVSLSLTP